MENDEKYTLEGLPVLTKGVVDVFIRDFEQRTSEGESSLSKLCEELDSNIKIKNPKALYFFRKILEYAVKSMLEEDGESIESIGDFRDGVTIGFGFLYDALKRQAEAYQLEDEYSKKPYNQTT